MEKLTELIRQKDIIINHLLAELAKPSTYTAEKQPGKEKKADAGDMKLAQSTRASKLEEEENEDGFHTITKKRWNRIHRCKGGSKKQVKDAEKPSTSCAINISTTAISKSTNMTTQAKQSTTTSPQ